MANPFKPDDTDFTPVHGPVQGIAQSTQIIRPGLYIVATPIGNLRDITIRALDILSVAETIYCEDTRVTQRLCSAYGIKAKLERCDEHTEERRVQDVIDAVNKGQVVAFVSDAGTPCISDPGTKLVAACRGAGIAVYPIPGPNAAIAAVSAAGLDGAFLFLGFLPTKSGARRQALHDYKDTNAILVLYEAPQRVADLLLDIDNALGARQVVIARELTKLHETFYRGTPAELAPQIDQDDFKGELVVLIAPSTDTQSVWTDDAIDQALRDVMATKPLKEAVADVTAKTGLPRKVIYARALAIK